MFSFVSRQNLASLGPHLETHSRLDFLSKNLTHDLIKVCHDLDSQLWFNATTADQIIERICERSTNAGTQQC